MTRLRWQKTRKGKLRLIAENEGGRTRLDAVYALRMVTTEPPPAWLAATRRAA